jgi:uncharacterized protein (UPF0333 family)
MKQKKCFDKKAQMTIEYAVMFVVIVAAILIASKTLIAPAINRFMGATAVVINNAAADLEAGF